MFVLEALQADHGDSLLLRYGPDDNPRLIVIDGGPRGVYAQSLRPRLLELKPKNGPLPIRLIMVSHVDDDHIRGILDLTEDLIDRIDAHKPLPYRVGGLWHNSFDDVIGNLESGAVAADVAVADLLSHPQALPADRLSFDTAAVVASVPQGRDLRNNARRLKWRVNHEPKGWAAGGKGPIDMGDGLTLDIVAPRRAQLEEMEKAWDKKLKSIKEKEDRAAEIAAFLDKSVYNLASIVVVARCEGKTMLLTGDARGDHILESLRESGYLENGSCRFDLLKMPHHGSHHNVAPEFFEAVKADHYVFSGDGRHGNPEIETFEMLTKVRGSAPYTIHLTNREDRLDAFFQEDRSNGRRYDVVARPNNALFVAVALHP